MRSQKGITLVALVVTIIVLLILAGVTIALVLGQDGIFGKAQTAATETNKQDFLQTVQMVLLNMKVDSYSNTGAQLPGNDNNTTDSVGMPSTPQLAAERVKNILESNYGYKGVTTSDASVVYNGVTVTIEGTASAYTAKLAE